MASTLRGVVIDNGGGTLKAGFCGEAQPRSIFLNTAARIKRQQRILVGDEIDTKIRDHSQLQYVRPLDRGYVTDFNCQSLLWERVLGPAHLDTRPEDAVLLYTAAPFAPATLQRGLDELVFETIGFQACHRAVPAHWLSCSLRSRSGQPSQSTSAGAGASSAAASKKKLYDVKQSGSSSSAAQQPWWSSLAPSVPRLDDCGLPVLSHGTGVVVDVGFSGCNVTPMAGWQVVGEGVRRLPVGGKHLTNLLKESLSYRQFNVMDDPWLVDRIKARLCYVALDYTAEHSMAVRMGALPVVPAALARLTARATGRLAMSQSASAAVPSSGPLTLDGRPVRSVASSVAAQVKAKLGMGQGLRYGAGEAGETGASSSSSGPSHAQARPLGSYLPALPSHGSADGAGASSSSSRSGVASTGHSHALPRPAPGTDGVGLGIRRSFVLPDYMRVQAGYVVGGPEDPDGQGQGTAAAGAGASSSGQGLVEVGASGAGAGAGADSSARPPTAPVASSSTGASGSRQDSSKPSGKRKRPQEDEAQAEGKAAKSSDSSASASKSKRSSKAKGEASGKDAAGENGGDDGEDQDGGDGEEEDTSSMSSSSSEDEEDDSGAGASGEYVAKSKGKGKGGDDAVPARRQTSARASKAGVSALTSTLRRGGLLVEGDEDEEGGGAAEMSSRAPLGVAMSSSGLPGMATARGAPGLGAGTSEAQVMSVNIERIAVPEVLFRPSDAGVDSVGLAEAVLAAVHGCPRYLWPALLSSIVLVGGGARLPGLEARLKRELLALTKTDSPLGLYTPADPIVATWQGGSIFGCRPDLASLVVTKAEYMEHGSDRIAARFALPGGGPANEQLEDAAQLEDIAARLKAQYRAQAAAQAAAELAGAAGRLMDDAEEVVEVGELDDPLDEDY